MSIRMDRVMDFNYVWFTNSYKDWDNLPDNVTLINLI